ncbi:capsid protein [Eubacterium barkeri]|nr:capsid protein [Eubacterium barkeri]
MLTHAAIRLLKIEPARSKTVVITEPLTFEGNVLRNRIWYRGDPSELEQFFKKTADDSVSESRFWASVPSAGNTVRKFHSGLPSQMVDRLSDIIMADLEKIELPETKELQKRWDDIALDNKFDDILSQAIADTLVCGDGAFKITFDTAISPYPIIEFYAGEEVEYTVRRGRIQEVKFKTNYSVGSKDYQLIEAFGRGYIKNSLVDEAGKYVSMSIIPDLEGVADVTFEGNFMLAVPILFFKSPKWNDRGKSIFDTKSDDFDVLDETLSQWADAVRDGRVLKYIPRDLLPTNEYTGEVMKPNSFDNKFIMIESGMHEDDKGAINLTQPDINYQAYCETYASNLDMCLQGIISPSTLGIDLKKTDNAEAQREKEKTTSYTRGKIVDVLEKVIPQVVRTALMAEDTLHKRALQTVDATVTFGEYAAPDFDSTVETVGKAKTYGVMSIEQCVAKLYGDSLTDEEKQEETNRLRAEQGLDVVEEPAVAGEDGLNRQLNSDG